MPQTLLTLRTNPAQMARFTRAAKSAKAKSRHAWALSVLEQAASTAPTDNQDWYEELFRWVDEQRIKVPEDAMRGERNR